MTKHGNEIFVNKSLKYSSSFDTYTVQLKKRRNYWWLLLLLLPTLLLFVFLPIKQRTGLPIRVVDKDTYEGLSGAVVKWKVKSGHTGSIHVDEDGNGILAVDSLFHGTIARIDASAEGYYDTTYYNVSIDDFWKDCITIKMRPKSEDYHVDIVMCIDNTGSMDNLISLVKDNALRFHSDLKTACAKKNKKIEDIRLRVLSFGDFSEKPISESGLLQIPSQTSEFREFVNGIEAEDGDDVPEDALEAVAVAIKTGWNSGVTRRRHIIIVYTDAPAHDLGFNRYSMFYPQEPMPMDFKEMTEWWNHLDRKASRLILFAPNESYWSRMNEEWPNVYLKSLDVVLRRKRGYEQILNAIANSL